MSVLIVLDTSSHEKMTTFIQNAEFVASEQDIMHTKL